MVCYTLLFIATLVVSDVTSLYCTDRQLPAASGDDNLQQVTTLQYCLVDDNCTIVRIDTGERLDVIHTTNSLLVVVPRDGHTSVVIAKQEKELPCTTPSPMPNDGKVASFLGQIALTTVIMMVSGYNGIVHLLFKELRGTFGMLLMLYSFSVTSMVTMITIKLIMHYKVAVNSQFVCQVTINTFMVTSMAIDSFATCVLTHLAYIMYCSHHSRRISDKRSKYLFKRYIAYVVVSIAVFLTVIVAYDLISGSGKSTLQPDGHCIFFNQSIYKSYLIMELNNTINKFIQAVAFSAYLYYFCKLKQTVSGQYSHKLSNVAIGMGATIGLSKTIWPATYVYPDYYEAISAMGGLFLFIQQCVITTAFMCTDKMSQLCKEFFSKNQVEN